MKPKDHIELKIKQVTASYLHVLDCYPASVIVNMPKALMQLTAVTYLDALHWTLGTKRRKFKCDNFKKLDA